MKQLYQTNNLPHFEDILREFKLASARGVIIVNITQCQHGSVSAAYEAGAVLENAGVVQGADMTPEAALAKLSYVLAIEGLSVDEKRKMLTVNLRGELTQPDMKSLSLENNSFLTTVAASLRASSNTEMDQIKQSLFPSLMCSAAKLGDMETLAQLRREGGDYSVEDVSS